MSIIHILYQSSHSGFIVCVLALSIIRVFRIQLGTLTWPLLVESVNIAFMGMIAVVLVFFLQGFLTDLYLKIQELYSDINLNKKNHTYGFAMDITSIIGILYLIIPAQVMWFKKVRTSLAGSLAVLIFIALINWESLFNLPPSPTKWLFLFLKVFSFTSVVAVVYFWKMRMVKKRLS